MAYNCNILLAGFGGQGILFTGKLLAKCAMELEKEVTWMPSYGPEMRGGTANCSVIVSDERIGSPIVVEPDILMAMNLPSLDKFENSVVPGGTIIVDSSLISRKVERDDVNVVYIPATQMANENGLKGLANVIMAAKIVHTSAFIDYDKFKDVIRAMVPAKKAHLLEPNLKAADLGYNF
ncbi:MAG: 2-oxoacid:ferredoxin oxidoreductase subunit gamma [Ruminococcaceae bacterium]|nr:2-oxoacid:ferredoxin oxidoreductase subunit gamma [Oscillospiraceae bacterium]